METQITARHFDADNTLRHFAAKRLSKLERFYDGITDAHVILSEGNRSVANKSAEINVNVFRQQLNACDTANSYEEAIDRCVERLRRQILKYKGKLKSKHKDYHR